MRILSGSSITIDEVVPGMSAAQARQCVQEINLHLNEASRHEEQARAKARQLYEQQGWRALGYPSFRECAKQEFVISWQQVYRLVDAAVVDENLTALSPTGETVLVPETHARELKRLPQPDQQYDAVRRAQRIAKSEGASKTTRKHVAQAVRQIEAEVIIQQSAYPLLAHMVETGDLTAKTAKDLARELDAASSVHRGYVLDLIARYTLCNPRLIAPIVEMRARQDTKPSKVLPEIETGFLGGVPLSEATVSDLERARDEARHEWIAEEQERKRERRRLANEPVIEPVVLTLWKGDVVRSVKALRQALGEEEFAALVEAMVYA